MSAAAVAAVRERPILFSAPMVRAILDGRKSQTRRVAHFSPDARGYVSTPSLSHRSDGSLVAGWHDHAISDLSPVARCPYGAPGDRLWVRETWGQVRWVRIIGWPRAPRVETVYRAGPHSFDRDVPHGWTDGNRWRPSIHMPRRLSRLTLEVTRVRVERLQDIGSDGATAEGIEWDAWDQCAVTRNYAEPDAWFQMWDEARPHYAPPERLAIESFRSLWDSLNAKRGYGWDANPFVWVTEFRRVLGEGR